VPGTETAEIYFIAAMMLLILIISFAAVYFFFRQYKKEMKARDREKQYRELEKEENGDENDKQA
jgi:preprotein translocase subunit YajC